jgi:hypothetical protein
MQPLRLRFSWQRAIKRGADPVDPDSMGAAFSRSARDLTFIAGLLYSNRAMASCDGEVT